MNLRVNLLVFLFAMIFGYLVGASGHPVGPKYDPTMLATASQNIIKMQAENKSLRERVYNDDMLARYAIEKYNSLVKAQ